MTYRCESMHPNGYQCTLRSNHWGNHQAASYALGVLFWLKTDVEEDE